MSESRKHQPLPVRFYAWLIQLYPKDFRTKFGHEILQTFGDRWRAELKLASTFRKLAYWADIMVDFLTTAPFEYLSKGEDMDTVEKNLRWDLRYGVQVFLRHSAMALKYAAWAGISLLGIYAIAIVTVALYSSHEARRIEGAVNQTLTKAIGQTPQEAYRSILNRYPKSEKNKSAIELETIAARLGIDNPESGTKWGSQAHGRMGPFGSYDAPPYLYAQLNKPFDEIDPLPPNIQEYLNNHRLDLDELYNLILQNEAPHWEIDIQKGYEAPVPNLFFNHQLQAIIALDILKKTRRGEYKKAVEAFEASWKISQSLRDRPEMISQYISVQVLNRQAGILRKMKEVPPEWQQRISQVKLIDSVLQSLTLDASVFGQVLAATNERIYTTGWDSLFLTAPLSGPLRRLIAMRNLELTGEVIAEFQKTGICGFDSESFRKIIEGKTSRWFLGNNLVLFNTDRPFIDRLKTSLYLELTQTILETREELANLKLNRPEFNDIKYKSSICSKASWVREISPKGTIHINVIGIPEWIKVEDRLLRLPLEYSLQVKNL